MEAQAGHGRHVSIMAPRRRRSRVAPVVGCLVVAAIALLELSDMTQLRDLWSSAREKHTHIVEGPSQLDALAGAPVLRQPTAYAPRPDGAAPSRTEWLDCPSDAEWLAMEAAVERARDASGAGGGLLAPDPSAMPLCHPASKACVSEAPGALARHLAELVSATTSTPLTELDGIWKRGASAPRNDELDGSVYVYDSPRLRELNANSVLPRPRAPWQMLYEADETAFEALLNSSLRTLDASKARWFFVPLFVPHVFHRALREHADAGFEGWAAATQRYALQAMRMIRDEFPHFDRSHGEDHIVPVSFGTPKALWMPVPDVTSEERKELVHLLRNVTMWTNCRNSDALTTHGEAPPGRPYCFALDRDRLVVMPPLGPDHAERHEVAQLVAHETERGARRAESLALFRGAVTPSANGATVTARLYGMNDTTGVTELYSARVRQALSRMYAGCVDSDVSWGSLPVSATPTRRPGPESGGAGQRRLGTASQSPFPTLGSGVLFGESSGSFVDELSNTTFLLCPEGLRVYTPRPLEALEFGAVPVVFGEVVLPFAEQLDWSTFSVWLPNWAAPLTQAVLESLDPERVRALQRNTLRAIRFLSWHDAPDTVLRLMLRDSERMAQARARRGP